MSKAQEIQKPILPEKIVKHVNHVDPITKPTVIPIVTK